MGGALEWISKVAEWFGKFIPCWVLLDTTMGGVMFVRGKNVVEIGPGVHWYWPAWTKLDTYPTARQADDLRSQTMVTTDDKVIAVGGMIVYSVHSVATLLGSTYNPAATIKDIALSAIHDVCCQMSWPELKEAQRKGTLDTRLKNSAKKVLDEYGVTVLKVMLTDLAPCRVVKQIQSISQDE